uniref:ribosomal protein L21 n=1 Tax=Vacuolaria virescens TaxID=44451 RepID=UPI00211405A1|nr:ribosomal protein L21 [Vacuolaria virescens]UTE94689.1 ribosomal protein L21 [Vacuolaria virescens]
MEYAIVEISGHQIWLEPNKHYAVNHVPLKVGTKLFLKRVLLVKKKNLFLGFPYLENARIEATVLNHFEAKKVLVYKMKPKKKYRRKNGHRQKLTALYINNIII